MDYTVHGILQPRILEWVAFPFSRGSSQPWDQTVVSRIAGRFFTSWPTRETQVEYECEHRHTQCVKEPSSACQQERCIYLPKGVLWSEYESWLGSPYLREGKMLPWFFDQSLESLLKCLSTWQLSSSLPVFLPSFFFFLLNFFLCSFVISFPSFVLLSCLLSLFSYFFLPLFASMLNWDRRGVYVY